MLTLNQPQRISPEESVWVLESQVFSHLLKLPIPYFAHRPTGTLMVRLQGVETVREFLSGAAVMLLLDLP